MEKQDLLETGYKLSSALNTIRLSKNGGQKLVEVLAGMGFTNERLQRISDFLENNTTEEEFNTYVEKRAFVSYVEGTEEIEKYIEMANGYQAMGEINLEIAEESLHLEEEGEKLTNEVVTENSKGETESK